MRTPLLHKVGLQVLLLVVISCHPRKPAIEAADGDSELVRKSIDSLKKVDAYICDDRMGLGFKIENPAYAPFIAILEGPNPAADFKRVFEEGTPAAKIYSLCGLYFCSPSDFHAAVEQVIANPIPGDVFFGDADQYYKQPVMDIIKAPDPNPDTAANAVSLIYGETLPDYMARTAKFGMLDIYGGGLPVRLLDASWWEFCSSKDFPGSEVVSLEERRRYFIQERFKFYSRWNSALQKEQK